MFSLLKRYSIVLGVQLKNNWVREAVYRTNFITAIIVDLIWIGVEFSLFTIIYSHVHDLAGWTKPQVYFFLGVFFASDALFTFLFQRNFWQFSDLVNKGELDILLTKPIHPLFLALTRYISMTSIFNVGLGLAIIIKYSKEAGFAGGWHWFALPLWLLVGLLTQLLVRFVFTIWVFWTERGFSIAHLYYAFYNFATKPDTIFPKAVRYVVMTALPFAFIGSVPARALLKGLSAFEMIAVATSLTFFFFADIFLWRKGMKRYQSASS